MRGIRRVGSMLGSAVALAAVVACGGNLGGGHDRDGGGESDAGEGNADGGGGERADADGTGGSDAATGSSTCENIDLVISVDPSGSMTEELDAIRDEVFPDLATRLLEVGEDLEDFRVGAMDACPDPAAFHTRGVEAGECDFDSGEVWMDSNSSDLVGEFSCVGDLYTDDVECSGDNDDEQPASAAAQALEPPFIDEQNAGFLREDAVLVVMAITDEDEQPCDVLNDENCGEDPDSADEVYERLRAVKDEPDNIVFYGIGGEPPDGCDSGEYGSADGADKLRAITDRFIENERGVWQDLCAGNLEDGIDEAIQVIDSACDDIIVE